MPETGLDNQRMPTQERLEEFLGRVQELVDHLNSRSSEPNAPAGSLPDRKGLSQELEGCLTSLQQALDDENITGAREQALGAQLRILQAAKSLLEEEPCTPKKLPKLGITLTATQPNSNFLLDVVESKLAAQFKKLLRVKDLSAAVENAPDCLTDTFVAHVGRVSGESYGVGMLIAQLPEGPLVGIELCMRKANHQWNRGDSNGPASNYQVTITVAPIHEASDTLLAIEQTELISYNMSFDEDDSKLGVEGTVGSYSFMPGPFGRIICREVNTKFPDPTIATERFPARPWDVQFLAKMYGSNFIKAFRAYFEKEMDNGLTRAHQDLKTLVDSGDLQTLIFAASNVGSFGSWWGERGSSVKDSAGGLRGASRGGS